MVTETFDQARLAAAIQALIAERNQLMASIERVHELCSEAVDGTVSVDDVKEALK